MAASICDRLSAIEEAIKDLAHVPRLRVFVEEQTATDGEGLSEDDLIEALDKHLTALVDQARRTVTLQGEICALRAGGAPTSMQRASVIAVGRALRGGAFTRNQLAEELEGAFGFQPIAPALT